MRAGPLTLLLAALLMGFAFLTSAAVGAGRSPSYPSGFTPTAHAMMPVAMWQAPPAPTATPPYACPASSTNQYAVGDAFQYDLDNPVRPAWNHADKNLALRSYTPNTDPLLKRELVDYGSDDPTAPPQLATLFFPNRVPPLIGFYRVYDWIWEPSPDPGHRGLPLTTWPVTAMGLRTTPGETLRVPWSGYDIGGGMEALVLFADADSITLRYAREDSVASAGYTVHVDHICTDVNLLARYNQTDNPNGPRYVYVPPNLRPYVYPLPNVYSGQPYVSAGQALGTARSTEAVVAVVDSGSFMDTRSCNEWWRVRPGYPGTCPPGPAQK